jgi:hypothetical protein
VQQQDRPRTSLEMDRTLPKIPFFENKQLGVLITPGGWMGVVFWTMAFYNLKKFNSKEVN